jgi:hypothetical protein
VNGRNQSEAAGEAALTHRQAYKDIVMSLPDGSVRAIQVNFCKSPVCNNFGVPARRKKHARRAANGSSW